MDEPTQRMRPPGPLGSLRTLGARIRNRIRRELPLRILVGILLIIITAAALWPAVYLLRQPRPAYATAHIGDVVISLEVSGTVKATTYQADFPMDGTLSQIDVTVGQRVKQGDILAKLNVSPFQSTLTNAQNNESAAQQTLNAAQTSQTQAQSAQSEAQNAVFTASSALTAQQSAAQTECFSQPSDPNACAAANAAVASAQAQLDAAQTQFASAQAQLSAAQTQVAKAQKSATTAQGTTRAAQALLAAATLTAPHDGVIATINGAVGGRPGATASGVGSFITILDTSAPLATAMVNFRQVAEVRVGDAATFRVTQASSSSVFTGVVTGVSPVGQGTGDALSYPVLLRLDPSSLGGVTLLPGMTAATRIITHARYHVVVIPNSAVDYAREAAPASGTGLISHSEIDAALATAKAMRDTVVASGFDVANDPLTPAYLVGFQHNHYIAIPVVLGLTDGSQWEVVSGLQSGDQVVNGQRNLLFE